MTATDYSAERVIGSMISDLDEALKKDLVLLDERPLEVFSKRLADLSQLMIHANEAINLHVPSDPEGPQVVEKRSKTPPEQQEILLKIFLSLANLQQDILQHADQIRPEDMRNIRERTEQFLVFVSENEDEIKPDDG